jgi:hypothetical protein
MRLNLGCGQNPIEGWTNVDWIAGPGVDLVVDLESDYVALEENSVEEVFASHLIEHIKDPLNLMQHLWWACPDGAKATFLCPYGSSDDADEDPTHVRRMFINSWAYFAQPTYWRGNTNYRGDWRPLSIQLRVSPDVWMISDSAFPQDHNRALNHLYRRVQRERNVVAEMCAVLECVKPARERQFDRRDPTPLVFEMVEPGQENVLLGGVRL